MEERCARFLPLMCAVVALADVARAEAAAGAEEAAAIAREATVWGYPPVVMPNTLRHVAALADHTNRTVVMPNNDTGTRTR